MPPWCSAGTERRGVSLCVSVGQWSRWRSRWRSTWAWSASSATRPSTPLTSNPTKHRLGASLLPSDFSCRRCATNSAKPPYLRAGIGRGDRKDPVGNANGEANRRGCALQRGFVPAHGCTICVNIGAVRMSSAACRLTHVWRRLIWANPSSRIVTNGGAAPKRPFAALRALSLRIAGTGHSCARKPCRLSPPERLVQGGAMRSSVTGWPDTTAMSSAFTAPCVTI